MRRQRSCYTLAYNDGRDNYLEETEDSSNNGNVSVTSPFALLNWPTHHSRDAEFLPHGRNSRTFGCDHQYRPYNLYSGLNSNMLNGYMDLQPHGYGAYSNLYQPGYEFFGNAMGDPSDYSAQGILGIQRQNNIHYHQDRDGSDHAITSECESHLNSPSPQPVIEPNLAMSAFGTVFLILPNLVRIDISPDRNVYVTNNPGRCVGVLNLGADQSCIIHPNGRILQDGSEINMQTDNKSAKISNRGIVFTTATHALRYLVDASGTKSTSEKFKDLSYDFSFPMFYGRSKSTNKWLNGNCYTMISDSKFKSYSDGNKMWIVGGIRIKQDRFSEISVALNGGQMILKTSPTVNYMSIQSRAYSTSVSCHPVQHFHVRRGSKSVTAGSSFMSVQNGSQKAGFDKAGRLVLH